MRYLSVCSGIEAATVAWHPLGWTPVAFSEIEPFPAAVLAHHYPDVPNYGDMTKHKEWPLEPGSIDLLVGGTPCQSFSVAGLRKGISDPRGGLMLTYLEIAQRLRPRWIVWENVPGVLSSGGGRDFGSFLGALGELGYGWAYRVLDAQWVRTQRHPRAVPQRRRRVFVVGCLGDGDRAAQVLFERESVQRDSAKGRAQGEGAPSDAEAGAQAGCCYGGADANCSDTVTSKWSKGSGGPSGNECGLFLAQPVAGPICNRGLRSHTELDGHGAYIPVQQPVPYDLFQITAPVNRQNRKPGDPCHTLARDNAAHAAVVNMQGSKSNACVSTDSSSFTLNAMHGHDVHAVAFNWQNGGGYGNANEGLGITIEGTGPIQRCNTPAVAHAVAKAIGFDGFQSDNPKATHQATIEGTGPLIRQRPHCVATQMTVRRLTPRECERLQAFPDDYTLIPWRKKPADECPDGPRYKALGNSMAVNCMAWIGERIAAVESNFEAALASPLPSTPGTGAAA